MKKLFSMILVLGLLLVSCTEKEEKYFANCIKDGEKYLIGFTEEAALTYCKWEKENSLDEFKYYKGKIFSRNSKDALTPDEESEMWDKILKKVNKKKK